MLFVEKKYQVSQKRDGIENEKSHSLRKMNHVLQLVKELRIKSKTVLNWSLRKKRECIFSNVYFVTRKSF